MSAAIEVAVLS